MSKIETNESKMEQINTKLDNLALKIYDKFNDDKFYSYEKDDAGNYFAKVNGVKLEVPFSKPEDLIKALESIKYLINTYVKNGYNGKLYVSEDITTKGDRYSIIDLKIDNRKFLWDTTFLTGETIKKVFGINDIRNRMETQKLADFLNQVLEKKQSN